MSGPFASRLAELTRDLEPGGRRWVFVAYDQLNDGLGWLARLAPRELGVIVVECPEKAGRRPYHQQKLGYVLGNMRQFALEQAARGVLVRHVVSASYLEALTKLAAELGPLTMMEAAERELRHELAPLIASGGLVVTAHEGWLTSAADFSASQKRPPWKMEPFYQHVRKRTGILMEG
ncbi:MAG TPA: cryptochrome/photolyase family protein, partial [Myxococcota bacterium]|nr:cryptochrome/photolyase family protein [Myxococcota bacterium]